MKVKTMRELRKTLVEERPFRVFQIYCSECNDVLIEVSDLTESPFKDEALVLHRIENHANEAGHYSFNGNVEPRNSLQHIDTTITVNENV